MLLIGLTGGIGSGKSVVTRLFRARGVPVIDADEIAHQLTAPGAAALREIATAFGPGVLCPDGSLDRRALRAQVFGDDVKRRRLEAILHPAIRARTRELLGEHAARGVPYAINAVPLLLETKQQAHFDRVLVVDVPREVQIERVRDRDATSVEAVERVLSAQVERSVRLAAADDVIDNTATLEELERSVERLHRSYLALAQRHGKASP